MSLKAFHIFFILTALGLMGYMLYFSGNRYFMYGENGQNLGMASFAIAGLVLGIPYLGWFIRKNKILG